MDYYDFEYRVRYGDTDKMGISYYANYFVWFEAARTEYFRELGLPYTECEAKGLYLPVIKTGAEYHSSCTYDDLVTIRTSVSEMKRTSIRFEYIAFLGNEEKKISTGFSLHVFVDQKMKPCRVPADIVEKVTEFKLL